MPLFTQEHYDTITSITKNLLAEKPELDDTLEWLLLEFSEYFEANDSEFDDDKFMLACGFVGYRELIDYLVKTQREVKTKNETGAKDIYVKHQGHDSLPH